MKKFSTSILISIVAKVALGCLGALCLFLPVNTIKADLLNVVNSGFEDTTGQSTFNEFTFGVPVGWTAYSPTGIAPGPGVFYGTLTPNGTDFFNQTAPEGSRVAILFNDQSEGDGEWGLVQTLSDTLQANTTYTLQMEVGNIASGVASNGAFFNLDEFPGYRVDLMAGGVVVASDNNSLNIPEAEWGTSTVAFTTGDTNALFGQNLGIRVVNLNVIPAGFIQATSPDLEVDFDDIRLNAVSAIPEPSSMMLLAVGFTVVLTHRRR